MKIRMPVKNILRKLLKEQNITPYAFWKAIDVGQNTAYRLCNDPDSVPSKKIMDKILDAFGWLPGDYLVNEDDWNDWVSSLPLKEGQEILAQAESFKRKTPDGRLKKSDSEIIKLPYVAA
ncbi:MAG: helix-turn-helix transcriptional regulator [Prochloraceae cyanobacterium]|nr:helix-turn-helix transcriptional regulator [Prochloraceae cyanobacterium]